MKIMMMETSDLIHDAALRESAATELAEAADKLVGCLWDVGPREGMDPMQTLLYTELEQRRDAVVKALVRWRAGKKP